MITIHQKPRNYGFAYQKLIVTASSDNVANTGFKYLVRCTDGNTNIDTDFIISPNPNNYLVFDLYPYATALLGDVYQNHNEGFSITNECNNALAAEQAYIKVVLLEMWEVGGVLTEDPDSLGAVQVFDSSNNYAKLQKAWHSINDGLYPPLSFYECNSSTDYVYSDRLTTTHRLQYGNELGLTDDGTKVYIPCFPEDHGILCAPYDPDATPRITQDYDVVRLIIIDSSGVPHTFDQTLDPNGSDGRFYFAAYPANLNDGGGAFNLNADYPNWKYYQIFLYDTGSSTVRSRVYVFINAELYGQHDCKHDRVRLGWTGLRGGWDYFNFIKKNEESIQTEGKRYRKIVGNYGSVGSGTDFAFTSQDRGLTEIGKVTQQFLTITSDWLQEGEFAFLKSLIASQEVQWIQDDGTAIPVLVEDTSYTAKRERSNKLYNLTLRLRLANDLTL